MRKRIRTSIAIAGLLLAANTSDAARNFQLKGKNDISGGFGFQAGFTDWDVGGFKWFNEYDRELGRVVWLNVQLNFILGGDYRWGYGPGWGCGICGYDGRGRPIYCGCGWGARGFSGWGIEAGIGVKLKWRAQRIPLQFHAKFGGIISPLFYGWAEGVALGYRGGFGIRYFVLPNLGIGGEFMHDLGPAYGNNGIGWHFYGTFDFEVISVEFRF